MDKNPTEKHTTPSIEVNDFGDTPSNPWEILETSEYDQKIIDASNQANKDISSKFDAFYSRGASDRLSSGDLSRDTLSSVMDGYTSSLYYKHLKRQASDIPDKLLLGQISSKVNRTQVHFANAEHIRDLDQYVIQSAIGVGAFVKTDEFGNQEVSYRLPIDKVPDPALQDYFEKNNIDTSSEDIRQTSYYGFANILRATQDLPPEEGSKQLNWYFDTFHYGDNMSEFLDQLNGASVGASANWQQKYNDFLESRPEYHAFIKDINAPETISKEISSIEKSAQKISMDDFLKQIANYANISEEELAAFTAKLIGGKILDGKLFDRAIDTGTANSPKTKRTFSYGLQKIACLYGAARNITETVDPHADIFIDSYKISKDTYFVLRFGCNGENHVICESPRPNSAAYTWHGEGDGWRDALIGMSKKDAIQNPGVDRFPHLDSRGNPWDNLCYIALKMGVDLKKQQEDVA